MFPESDNNGIDDLQWKATGVVEALWCASLPWAKVVDWKDHTVTTYQALTSSVND